MLAKKQSPVASDKKLIPKVSYELLRLKYVKCLLAKDNITALFLLRNELNKYPKLFEPEQKKLSQLFLCKNRREIISVSGLDVENPDFLEAFLKNLETRNMCGSEEGLNLKDPFEEFIRRYLGFEVLGCRFHRPGSHRLIERLRGGRGRGR